jgi:hypothetical protein
MKTMRITFCAAFGALLIAALPVTAHAQDKSRSQGFFVGAGLEGTAVSIEDEDSTDSGGGFGVTVGYGFTPRLAIYGHFSGANVDSNDLVGEYGVGHFDIGARVHFRAPANTVVPFFQAALSSRALTQDFGSDEIEASGIGFAVGGGINAHFTQAFAFSAGATWSFGNLGNFKVNGSEIDTDSVGMSTARVHVGIVWFPQAK